MNKLIGILASGGLLAIGLAYLNDASANRIAAKTQAQVALIHASTESRNALLAGMLPYTIIAVALIVVALCLVTIVYVSYLRTQQQPQQPTRLVQQQIYFISMESSQSKRDFYHTLPQKLLHTQKDLVNK